MLLHISRTRSLFRCMYSLLADELELLVAPDDQTAAKGQTIYLSCAAVGISSNRSVSKITWKRSKPVSRGKADELTNATERVAVYHMEEERENGVFIVKSILELSCLEFEDAGMYSCHATDTVINRTAEFGVTIEGTIAHD